MERSKEKLRERAREDVALYWIYASEDWRLFKLYTNKRINEDKPERTDDDFFFPK